MTGQTSDSDALPGSTAPGRRVAPVITLTAKAFRANAVNQRVGGGFSHESRAAPRCDTGAQAVEMPIRVLTTLAKA